MPIGSSDGTYFETQWDQAHTQATQYLYDATPVASVFDYGEPMEVDPKDNPFEPDLPHAPIRTFNSLDEKADYYREHGIEKLKEVTWDSLGVTIQKGGTFDDTETTRSVIENRQPETPTIEGLKEVEENIEIMGEIKRDPLGVDQWPH